MLRTYQTVTLALRPLAALWGRFRGRDADSRRAWRERCTVDLPRVPAGGIWIHGSSVGEARIVEALARQVKGERPTLAVSVSAHTRTGRAALPPAPLADARFMLPLDVPGYPTRLLEAVQPVLLALVETELWPNLIRETRRYGAAAILVNGRLSAERMRRYRRFRGLYRPVLRQLNRIGAQSAEDAARFVELGAREDSLRVTGNLKYDLAVPQVDPERWRRRLGIEGGRSVFVAGSTGRGEDELVLEAYRRALADHPGLLLILAPRHVDRAPEVEQLVRSEGLGLSLLSAADRSTGTQADVVLVDTMGQLAELYAIADLSFVGGSLVPIGGHNVLEPAAMGSPVLFGPHTGHFEDPAQRLLEAGAALRVRSAGDLGRTLTRLLADHAARVRMGQAGGEVLRAHRGALARSAELLFACLAEAPRAGSAA